MTIDNFINPKDDTSEEIQHDLIKGVFEIFSGWYMSNNMVKNHKTPQLVLFYAEMEQIYMKRCR